MTRPSLAGIEQRTAAATEEPWEVNGPDEDWAVIHSGPDSVIHAYTVHDPACEGCECGGDEAGHVAISVEDAEFIAAARTDLPALTAAVRDVLALHQPCDNDITRTPICQTCRGRAGVWECGCWADEDRQPVCSSCTDSDPLGRVTPSAYPCPTVHALAAHLGLTDPEGEPT